MKKKYEINLYEKIVHIKKYEKINDINPNCIVIKLIDKIVKIYGKDLIISKLDKYEICINGVYKNIELLYEENKN